MSSLSRTKNWKYEEKDFKRFNTAFIGMSVINLLQSFKVNKRSDKKYENCHWNPINYYGLNLFSNNLL